MKTSKYILMATFLIVAYNLSAVNFSIKNDIPKGKKSQIVVKDVKFINFKVNKDSLPLEKTGKNKSFYILESGQRLEGTSPEDSIKVINIKTSLGEFEIAIKILKNDWGISIKDPRLNNDDIDAIEDEDCNILSTNKKASVERKNEFLIENSAKSKFKGKEKDLFIKPIFKEQNVKIDGKKALPNKDGFYSLAYGSKMTGHGPWKKTKTGNKMQLRFMLTEKDPKTNKQKNSGCPIQTAPNNNPRKYKNEISINNVNGKKCNAEPALVEK